MYRPEVVQAKNAGTTDERVTAYADRTLRTLVALGP